MLKASNFSAYLMNGWFMEVLFFIHKFRATFGQDSQTSFNSLKQTFRSLHL